MRTRSLSHVVLQVSDLSAAEAFYVDALGFPVLGRISDPVHMTFFCIRGPDHVGHRRHDFALLQVDGSDTHPDHRAAGLAHVAFDVGDSLDDLRAAKVALASAGVVVQREESHGSARSLYVRDPDTNEIELFVDTAIDGVPAQGEHS
jgi:catechol 2,3-dioxygenase